MNVGDPEQESIIWCPLGRGIFVPDDECMECHLFNSCLKEWLEKDEEKVLTGSRNG